LTDAGRPQNLKVVTNLRFLASQGRCVKPIKVKFGVREPANGRVDSHTESESVPILYNGPPHPPQNCPLVIMGDMCPI